MSLNINTLLNYSINQTIIEDHNKFLRYLFKIYGDKYKFSLEELYDRYHINTISITLDKPIVTKKNRKPASIPDDKDRCVARCWGGEKSVMFNKETNEWSFGVRCKRKHLDGKDFCGTHQKEMDNGYLTHGRFNEPVPHRHYEKYKLKIESKLKENNI